MRHVLLFTVLLLIFSVQSFSQIDPWQGINDYDGCNWESSCAMFRPDTSASGALWQIGTPAKPFFGTAFSPPYAIMTDTVQPYPIGIHSWFQLAIPNSFRGNMLVSFRHSYQTDTLLDGGYIEISYDMGLSWTNVMYDTSAYYFQFNSAQMYSIYDTLKGGTPGFSGTSDGWLYSRIQWVWEVPVKMVADTLLLRFHFISDSIDNALDGWMIDDIVISYVDIPGAINDSFWDKARLFPNPFSDAMFVELSDAVNNKAVRLSLSDMFGRELKAVKLPPAYSRGTLSGLGHLPAGIYLLQVDFEGNSFSRKVMKR